MFWLGCVKAKFMAVLGLAFLFLVVMPFLIYVSLAWVTRAARLARVGKGTDDFSANIVDRR